MERLMVELSATMLLDSAKVGGCNKSRALRKMALMRFTFSAFTVCLVFHLECPESRRTLGSKLSL